MSNVFAVWQLIGGGPWTWAVAASMAAASTFGYGIIGFAARRHPWWAGASALATKIISPLAYAAVGANFDALRASHPHLHAGHATAAIAIVSLTMSAVSLAATVLDPTTRHAGIRAIRWLRQKTGEMYRDPFRHTHAYAPLHKL